MKNIFNKFFKFEKTDPTFIQLTLKVFLFLIPNFYFLPLRVLRNKLLTLYGLDLNTRDVYIKNGFYFENNAKIKIGKNVFINNNVIFEGIGSINIEDNVKIGPNTVLATTNHNISKNVDKISDVTIKSNTWIAASCIILPGVTLGPNVTVGAGSVVTKNYDNCTIAGNPAKKIIH